MKRLVLTIVLSSLCIGGILAQESQYKRIGLNAITNLLDGKTDTVISHLNELLKDTPDDAEMLFCLALAYAQEGQADAAMRCVKKSLDAGIVFSRYLTGPISLLKNLNEIPDFVKLKKSYPAKLLHGPMLGCLTDRSIKIWVRTNGETEVQVRYSLDPDLSPLSTSEKIKTKASEEYTGICPIDGLKPETTYFYQILVDGEVEGTIHSFHTASLPGQSGRLTIGFGGGAGYTPDHERMWTTIAANPLDAFLFLGDNVYIDHPEEPDSQRYCYSRRQSRQEYRAFTASIPIYSIWDDHDFITNDKWGGPLVDTPPWKRVVWNLYKTNWVNPAYGEGSNHPGCWFSFQLGDVDFIMLDGRYYRENPKKAHPSMLGSVQKEWLLDTLQKCKGTFKVLVSPVPWSPGTKPGSLDTWDGYPEEREEIFSWIEKNKIDGVVLLSADRHRSDAWKIERPKGYPFYEFESSRLTNMHFHKEMPGALYSYNTKNSFGMLSFDTSKDDPELVYTIKTIDNEPVFSMTVWKSQISFK